MHLTLFIIFAAACVAGALNLLIQRHPINSALSLIVVMASLAALYMLLGAEFVAAIQVIVYAGAIIVLLNAGEEERTRGSRVATRFGVPAVLLLAGVVTYVLMRQSGVLPVGALYGPPQQVGRLLFRDFLLPFEVTSVLILIAIMGAVVLAQRARSQESEAPGRREP